MMKSKVAALVFLMLLTPPVLAQSAATPNFDQRQLNQEQRIQQGAQSGALTPKEVTKLEQGQGRLQTKEDKAKADGKVTAKEREHFQHAQDKQSEKIYREKHDRQHDYNHDGKKDHPKSARK